MIRPVQKVWTVGELRDMGFTLDASIPDCAEAPGTVTCEIKGPGSRTLEIEWSFIADAPIHYVTITGTVRA